mmetsp:Transcript_1814/g.2321  ORF Transcript_1814/g.2321 Transcript_1814/m.2321 type:complete len:117 (-) Transcript_1814:10-360(-)
MDFQAEKKSSFRRSHHRNVKRQSNSNSKEGEQSIQDKDGGMINGNDEDNVASAVIVEKGILPAKKLRNVWPFLPKLKTSITSKLKANKHHQLYAANEREEDEESELPSIIVRKDLT